MNKIQSVALIVGIVFGVLLIVNAQATTFAQSDPQSTSVASGSFVSTMGLITYYTFSVPGDAVNPRLIGHYQVLS